MFLLSFGSTWAVVRAPHFDMAPLSCRHHAFTITHESRRHCTLLTHVSLLRWRRSWLALQESQAYTETNDATKDQQKFAKSESTRSIVWWCSIEIVLLIRWLSACLIALGICSSMFLLSASRCESSFRVRVAKRVIFLVRISAITPPLLLYKASWLARTVILSS